MHMSDHNKVTGMQHSRMPTFTYAETTTSNVKLQAFFHFVLLRQTTYVVIFFTHTTSRFMYYNLAQSIDYTCIIRSVFSLL